MNESQIRFYVACALAELSGRQAENAMRRLQEEPTLRIIEAIDEVIPGQMPRQDRQPLLGWASEALEPRQQGTGLEPYSTAEYVTVYQEVKNWAVVTAQDEATTASIRNRYMCGLSSFDREVALPVWDICDGLTERHKDILHEVVRNSPTSMTFRAA